MEKFAKSFVNFGTFGGAYFAEFADMLSKSGQAFLDAPISGERLGAQAGTLGIICSGDKSGLDVIKPNFQIICEEAVLPNGTAGAAQTMKLVSNIILFGNLAVAFEAMTIGATAGLDPEKMLQVINALSGRNTATEANSQACS